MSDVSSDSQGEYLGREFRAAFEQNIIEQKERENGSSESMSASGFGKIWRSIPDSVRDFGPVRKTKDAYVRMKKGDTHSYARLCMSSFMNYLLNKSPRLPKNADKEYVDTAKEVMQAYAKGAAGGRLGEGNDPYAKELASGIRKSGSFYEYKGIKLPKKMFAPEVFCHHHGLKILPQEVVARLKGKSILDIGAALGDSAAILSPYTDKKVYSFECNEMNYSDLLKTIEANGLKNIVPVKKAVGEKSGTIGFDGFPRDFYFHHKQNEKLKVDTVSVDDFVAQTPGEQVGLMKMDVEGFELEVIKGAAKTIQRDSPLIIASAYHTGKDFFEIPLLLEELNPKYRFKLVLLNREPPTLEANIIAY